MSGANWTTILIAAITFAIPAWFLYKTSLSKDRVAAQTNVQTGQIGAIGQTLEGQNSLIKNLQVELERVNKAQADDRRRYMELEKKYTRLEEKCDRTARELSVLKGGPPSHEDVGR